MDKTSEWLSSFSSQDKIPSLINPVLPRQTEIISITGGKGGVGKTSISLKMARELAQAGRKVLLIDSDFNLSNTAIKLGLPLNNTFFSLVSAEKNFQDCLYKEGNFHLLSACNGSIDLFEGEFKLEEVIIDIVNEHANEYDYVLIDCPAGLMKQSLTLNAYSDKRVVVVTPDKSSITDSYSLIKVLSMKYGIKDNHLLVNKVINKTQYTKVVKTLSETVENYLGCRTHILGGVHRLNVSAGMFDAEFLSSGKNNLQRNFLQVVKRLTEKLSDTRISESHQVARSHEQEVH